MILQAAAFLLSKMIKAALTERFLMRMVLLFGDWLVASTKNTIDNNAWATYKITLTNEFNKKGLK